MKSWFVLTWIPVFLFVTLLMFPGPGMGGSAREKALIAVGGFSLEGDFSSNPDFAGRISTLMGQALVRQGRVRVVEREMMDRLLAEEKLALTGVISKHSAAGEMLAAHYMVGGVVLRRNDEMDIVCRLIKADTGEVAASESIGLDAEDAPAPFVESLARMVGSNFSARGALVPKKSLVVEWDTYASEGSASSYAVEDGIGMWSYRVRGGEDDHAGIGWETQGLDLRGARLLFKCASRHGYPLHVRLYSFTPGFSHGDDDDTYVPVEGVIRCGEVAGEEIVVPAAMKVPEWWRKEKHAPDVRLNPGDIRQIELAAGEGLVDSSVRDQVELFRISVQGMAE